MNALEVIGRYGTSEKCIELLERVRWGDTLHCAYCNSVSVYRIKSIGNRIDKLYCNKCRCSFTVLTNTIFHNSKLPLPKWFMALTLVINAKKGLSSRQLGRDVGLPVKTAYRVIQCIRKAMLGNQSALLQGMVEMDECYIGGKPRKYNGQHHKRGRGTSKMPVVAGVERNGFVKAESFNAKRLSYRELRAFVLRNIDIDKMQLMTDDYKAYKPMNRVLSHSQVQHSLGEYVRGDIHTNTTEGFFVILKRAWYGQYHHYSKRYAPLYLAEACFKYNNRHAISDRKDTSTFEKLVKGMVCTS